MISRLTLITGASALTIGLVTGWVAQGWRLGAQLEQASHSQTRQRLAGAINAINQLSTFQEDLTDALQQFQRTQQANQTAAADLDRGLRDLRGVTAGLRGDFAGLPDRIASAAEPALREYASTCTAVFQELADRGGRMAERGSEIARQADGHAADVVLLKGAAGGK